MRHQLRRGAVLSPALVLLSVTAALAHPSFNPNQLPAGEAVDAVLVVPHGCDPEGGMPEEGGASPTVLLDLQLAPEVVEFEAHELEGWGVEREDDVVRWTATDGGTRDPIQFPVTVTIDGPVGEPFYLSAFQECEEGSFRWIGTPDEEAEYPAVKLTTTQGEIGTEQPEDGHAGTADDSHGQESEAEVGHESEEGPQAEQPEADPSGVADDSAEATAGTGASWIVIVVVLLVLAAGAAALWARRRGADQ